MATINRGILGGFSGRVANVVGSSWKGIATMRALPLSVLNPRTAAQVGNRTRFSLLSILAAAILTTIVKPLNDRFASAMSGYNLFTSRCKEAFNVAGIFVPANLTLSSGKLGDPVISSTVAHVDGTGEVTFPAFAVGAYEQTTDKAYAVLLNASGEVLAVSSGEIARDFGSITFDIDGGLALGSHVHFYLSFLRADGTIVSNSAHADITVVA